MCRQSVCRVTFQDLKVVAMPSVSLRGGQRACCLPAQGMLPPQAQDNERIRAHLNAALNAMNAACRGGAPAVRAAGAARAGRARWGRLQLRRRSRCVVLTRAKLPVLQRAILLLHSQTSRQRACSSPEACSRKPRWEGVPRRKSGL